MNIASQALEQSNRLKKISVSYIVSTLARASGFLLTLITTPMLLNYLGKDGFGLWSIFIQFYNFAAFSDFGLGNGLHNTLLTSRHTKPEAENILLIQRTFFLLISIAALLLIVFQIPLYSINWSSILELNNPALQEILVPSILVTALLFFSNVPFVTIQKVQFAYMDHHKVYTWEIYSKISAIVLIFYAVKSDLPIPYILAAFFAPRILCNILNIFTYKRLQIWKITKNSFYLKDKQVSSVAKKGGVFFLINIFYALGRTTDNFVIGSFASLEQLADYQILLRLYDIPLLLVMMFSTIMWSAFAESIHKKDYNWVKKTLAKAGVGVALIMASTIIFYAYSSDYLLLLWLGKAVDVNYSLLYVLGAWTAVVAINNLLSSFLNATDRILFQVKIFAAYFIIAFPLKIILIQMFSIESFVIAGTATFTLTLIIPSLVLIMKDLSTNSINLKRS